MTTKQAQQTLTHVAKVSGLRARANTHSLRSGAARDVAHLKDVEGAGQSSDTVRQSLGHCANTTARGFTEAYVGGLTVELSNKLLKAAYTSIED